MRQLYMHGRVAWRDRVCVVCVCVRVCAPVFVQVLSINSPLYNALSNMTSTAFTHALVSLNTVRLQ